MSITTDDLRELQLLNGEANRLYERLLYKQKQKTKQACRLGESMLQYLINNNDIEVDTAIKYKLKLQELKS